MQHPANDPVLAQNPFLDQAVQDLLDLRTQTNKNSVLQLCDLSSEIFHEVFPEQRMLGHVRIATIVIVIHKDRIPKGLPYLTGFVIHCEILDEELAA